MKNIAVIAGTLLVLILSGYSSFSQDITHSEMNVTPLSINPAFTGMYEGDARACLLYDNHWASVTAPFFIYGAAIDLPIFITKNGSYFAAGIEGQTDYAGDGNLTIFNGIVSLAYHKFFGKMNDSDNHNCELSFGLQTGYDQITVEYSNLYFVSSPPVQMEQQYTINYYPVNFGISFSQTVSKRFNYTIGLAGYNISRPEESPHGYELEFNPRIIGVIGANWKATHRLTIRPEILTQFDLDNFFVADFHKYMAGSEFLYDVNKTDNRNKITTRVFAGAYYRTDDNIFISAGVECRSLRLGVSYDYNIAPLSVDSNGEGGFAVSIKYILPVNRLFSKKRIISGTRF